MGGSWAPVPDNQNVVTAGPRGPQLLQDVWFLEKLAHFDRESHQRDLDQAIEVSRAGCSRS